MATRRYRFFRDKAERERMLSEAVARGAAELAEVIGHQGADVLISKYRGYQLNEIGERLFPQAANPASAAYRVYHGALVSYCRKTAQQPDYFNLFDRTTAGALRAVGFRKLTDVQEAVKTGALDKDGRYNGERLPGLKPENISMLHEKIDALRVPVASRTPHVRRLLRVT